MGSLDTSGGNLTREILKPPETNHIDHKVVNMTAHSDSSNISISESKIQRTNAAGPKGPIRHLTLQHNIPPAGSLSVSMQFR